MKAKCIALALGGYRSGSQWMAHCPAHRDRTPSLSIRDTDDGRVLFHCFAGCSQLAVISALTSRGLWPPRLNHPSQQYGDSGSVHLTNLDQDPAEKTEAALLRWNSANPIAGTLAAIYLASRGLTLPPTLAIRCHPGLKHPSGDTWPCMIALVTDGVDATQRAIHRTFLARDGSGKAPVDPSRMMLGPCRGGAVRLGQPKSVLMVGEGIETCLSAMQATGHSAWAALSSTGLRALELPRDIVDIIILADGDAAGRGAAEQAAARWTREGRNVRIVHAPDGMDFNDLLTRNAMPVEELR